MFVRSFVRYLGFSEALCFVYALFSNICTGIFMRIFCFMSLAPENEPERMANRAIEPEQKREKEQKQIARWSGLHSRSIRDCVYLWSCASCGCMFKYTPTSYSVRCVRVSVSVCVRYIFTTASEYFFMIRIALVTNFIPPNARAFICFLLFLLRFISFNFFYSSFCYLGFMLTNL